MKVFYYMYYFYYSYPYNRTRCIGIVAAPNIQPVRLYMGYISLNYISDLERGKTNPTLRLLNKICRGLRIKLYDLFVNVDDGIIEKVDF